MTLFFNLLLFYIRLTLLQLSFNCFQQCINCGQNRLTCSEKGKKNLAIFLQSIIQIIVKLWIEIRRKATNERRKYLKGMTYNGKYGEEMKVIIKKILKKEKYPIAR